MFSKLKSKVTAQRFVFTFHIHVLTPWPPGNQAIAIGWQRGKRRRGATRAVLPAPVPGRLSNAIKFNESFEIPATLYKSSSGSSTPFGAFKKKCVILAVLETDGRTQATAALGRVVIDLSEFASVDGQELRTFLVSCSKSIHAAVGEPQLTVTVRCRWKKAATVDKGNGDNSSMSTDTTGSTMTANLGSFMGIGGRRAPPRQPPPQQGGLALATSGVGAPSDQDLRGFQARDLAPIHEDDDERSRLSPTSSRDSTPTRAHRPSVGTGASAGRPPAPRARITHPEVEEMGQEDEDGKNNNTRKERMQLKEVGQSRVSDWLGSPPGARGAGTGGVIRSTSGFQVDIPDPKTGLPPRAGAGESRGRLLARNPSAPSPILAATAGLPGLSDPIPSHRHETDHSSDSEDAAKPHPATPQAASAASPRGETANKWRNRWSRTPAAEGAEQGAGPDKPTSVSGLSASADFKSFSYANSGQPLETSKSLEAANGLGRNAAAAAGLIRRQSSADKESSAEAKEVIKLRALKQELVSAAAVEASVYMARARAATNSESLRHVHTCARRLSRTIVCMGQAEGLAFARYSLHAIGHLIDTGHEDVDGMMWYWSNIVHMRGFMQSLNLAQAAKAQALGQPQAASQGHWAAIALVEPLSLLEQRIFLQLLNYVWNQVLIPLVGPTGRPGSPTTGAPGGAGQQAMDDRAVQRWLEALDAVAWRLGLSNPYSHIPLLRQQILMQVLKRIDNLLLGYLLYHAGALDHNLVAVSREAPSVKVPAGLPPVDDAVLPFRRGPLTFGAGMNVKMAVTRLQQWAFETVLMGDTVAGSMDGLSLFPHMRAAADLLMMPKELLMDRAIRSDVCSCLPVPAIVAIVTNFRPDEFAQDMVAPEVVTALRNEAGPRGMTMVQVPAINETVYMPPTDDVIMESVESGREPGLEYGDDSESELLDMAKMAAPGNVKKALRYKMLHELWATGVPRKRTYTTQH